MLFHIKLHDLLHKIVCPFFNYRTTDVQNTGCKNTSTPLYKIEASIFDL